MNIIVALKKTKWERDLIRYGSAEIVQRMYAIQNNGYRKIHDSHERQKANIALLRQALPDARFAHRAELPYLNFEDYDLIVSIGGDNHFIYVSHFASANTPIVGINSDPETSYGALLHFDASRFIAAVAREDFRLVTEDWSRISCELEYPDGRNLRTGPCTSEISVRSSSPDLISRYLIRMGADSWEEQKSSGLLLTTGAGSTGWFRNAHWGQNQSEAVFPKDAPYFRIIARELPAARKYRYLRTTVGADESLEIVSEMDGDISIDTHPETTFSFPPGCRARFRLSDNVLKVVREIKGPVAADPTDG